MSSARGEKVHCSFSHHTRHPLFASHMREARTFSCVQYSSKHQVSLNLARIATAGLVPVGDYSTVTSLDPDGEASELSSGEYEEQPLRAAGSASCVSVKTALHGCLPQLAEGELQSLASSLEMLDVPPRTTLQTKGDSVPGMYMVLSSGCTVLDEETGEWCGDRVLNADSLLFAEHTSRRTLLTGSKPTRIALLRTDKYAAWCHARLLLLRSRFSILDTLSNAALNSLTGDYKQLRVGETVSVKAVALVTHGVLHIAGTCMKAFPGHVLGVESAMQGQCCTATAETAAACFVISQDTFAHLMRTEAVFMSAVSELAFQQSVDAEGRESESSEASSVDRSASTSTCGQQHFPITKAAVQSVDPDGCAVLNQYRFETRIGGGGTCTVFLAQHRTSQERYACKVVNRLQHKSICREVAALQALRHPYIVQVEEVIDCSSINAVVFVQHYAAWGSLLGVQLPVPEARRCARCCTAALQYIHSSGFVHGDLKPANVLRDAGGMVVLADFGCCTSLATPPETRPAGTPAFMSPEAFEGRPGIPADVWGLVATLYCIVQGHAPFKTDSLNPSLRDAVCYSAPRIDSGGIALDDGNFVNMISRGLDKDDSTRITLHELSQHPWIRHGCFEGTSGV